MDREEEQALPTFMVGRTKYGILVWIRFLWLIFSVLTLLIGRLYC
jgi:hypothetical protein